MAATTAFAVVPSADLATARTWWTRLPGRERILNWGCRCTRWAVRAWWVRTR